MIPKEKASTLFCFPSDIIKVLLLMKDKKMMINGI